MSDNTPSRNGPVGRDARGRFTKGNAGGPGNPHARKAQQLRSAMLAATTQRDVAAIVKALIERAKRGDVTAAREVLDRCLGKPQQSIELEAEVAPQAKPGESADKPFEEMSDAEIAEVLARGGLPVPPVLRQAGRLVYEREGWPVPVAFQEPGEREKPQRRGEVHG